MLGVRAHPILLLKGVSRPVYKLPDYSRMVADEVRMRAYAGALAEVVRPDSVVVDIGTGTGVLALIAAKLGARRVYAIEISDVLTVARELARENGVEGRIEFLRGDSRALDLPEHANVIVSDLHGALPLFGDHLEIIVDARQRFLAPGGVLIPRTELLWAAPVECPEFYEHHLGPTTAPCGVTLEAARKRLRNLPATERDTLGREHLLAEPAHWGKLEYASVEAQPVTASLEWLVARGGVAHGVLLWFETVLGPRHGFATGPGARTVYPRVLLPFERPLPVESAERIRVDLWASAQGNPRAWSTTVLSHSGLERARWKQASFLAATGRPIPRVRALDEDVVPERAV